MFGSFPNERNFQNYNIFKDENHDEIQKGEKRITNILNPARWDLPPSDPGDLNSSPLMALLFIHL